MTPSGLFARWDRMRGDESLAHKCILSATWAARIDAIITAEPLLDAVLRPRSRVSLDWMLVVFFMALSAALFFLAERVKRGGRLAAVTLLLGTLWSELGILINPNPSERPYPYEGSLAQALGPIFELLIRTSFILCFALGVWGTFTLARAQREAQGYTPAEKDVNLPSRARRVMVILAYSCAVFAIVLIVAGSNVSAQCLHSLVCTPVDYQIYSLATLGWMGLSYLFIVLGWKGRLLGCRAERA